MSGGEADVLTLITKKNDGNLGMGHSPYRSIIFDLLSKTQWLGAWTAWG
ncbi:hypothetical protein ABID29_002181 [Streptococcus rupicaprae]|uniref:Uncharacterized protein n=1 Tax=Streptococcus rupicaprae TaxID=759619 RepID=A0ABV2FKG0_9STRE